MPEASRVNPDSSRKPSELARVVPVADSYGRSEAMAAFARDIRRLSNYEVWERVETAILAPRPSQEKAELESWRFRVLLDELQWRHSGIEGAGAVADLDRSVVEAHVH